MAAARWVPGLAWLGGLALIACLVVAPALGLNLLWNLLIPLAPALLVVATGLWRNLCPLGTTALLPERLGWSLGWKLSPGARAWLGLVAVLALAFLIPLRHVWFNTNGPAAAALLLGVGLAALGMGLLFERRSGWCNALCPVHPVERLYGQQVALSVANTACLDCVRCALPCPDWSPQAGRRSSGLRPPPERLAETWMWGAFPGWIWGWNLIPDHWEIHGPASLLPLYGYPAFGALCTLAAYGACRFAMGPGRRALVDRSFAASSVSMYYLFRIPQLLGFDPLHPQACLIDLSHHLPPVAIAILTGASTAFFLGWLVVRPPGSLSWSKPPRMTPTKPTTAPLGPRAGQLA